MNSHPWSLHPNASTMLRRFGAVVLAFALLPCSWAASVRLYFVNPDGGALDTNVFFVTAVGSNVLSSGGVVNRGVPVRVTPASNGYATNSLSVGHYSVSNRFLGNGVVIRVPQDTSSTVYDYTNLLVSGYNTFVTINPTFDTIADKIAMGTNTSMITNGGRIQISADVSAASVAAKAGTNNTTIWNLDARGFQTDSITNLAGNVFALFPSGGGFYLYDPNAGNPFLAGDDTTVSLYANAVEVFTGKEDYTEVKAQNTTNKLHISSDGNEFTGPVVSPKISGSTITGSNYVSGVMYFGGGSAVPRFTNGFVVFDSIEIFQGDIIVYNGGEVQATFRGNGEYITNLPSTAITGVITNAVRNSDSNYFNGQAHFGASSSVRFTNGWISFNGGIVESGDLIVRDGGEVQATFRGNGQYLTNLVLTTGTNVWWHNSTNIWSNPSGTIKTLFSDNAGNPSLTFLGQSDTPQLSIYWENGTSGGINAPYINGNGSSISYNGAGNNGNLATSVNTLQELNDAVDNLSLGGGSQNLEQVLQDGSNANGQNATNFNLISATNATFENLEIENQYVTNHYVTSLTSGRVTYATTGGQLTDDAGFTYDSSGDRVSVGAANVTNSINLLGSSISNAVGIYGVDNSTTASNLVIQAGTTSGAGGTSGNLVLKTGGTETGTAGSISATAGAATSTGGTAGSVSITAGSVQSAFTGGTAGAVTITGGTGNTTARGGNVTIVPGYGDSAGYGTNIFGGITVSSKSWNYFIGTNQFTDDVVAQSRLKVTGPAQITNTIYQSFAVNELATTGNETNFTVDFYATNTQTILATGNVYIASLDNLAAGRWKQLIITNVFKASSNITAYVQTNLLWLGPTNGYALGASPMHTNRAYPVTNVLVLSLQAIGSTAPSVLGYGIQSSP